MQYLTIHIRVNSTQHDLAVINEHMILLLFRSRIIVNHTFIRTQRSTIIVKSRPIYNETIFVLTLLSGRVYRFSWRYTILCFFFCFLRFCRTFIYLHIFTLYYQQLSFDTIINSVDDEDDTKRRWCKYYMQIRSYKWQISVEFSRDQRDSNFT